MKVLMTCLILTLVFCFSSFTYAAEPVEIGCQNLDKCGVDPCQIAPEKCKNDSTGSVPNTSTKPSTNQQSSNTSQSQSEDPCKYCVCVSGTTVHPACLECCQ